MFRKKLIVIFVLLSFVSISKSQEMIKVSEADSQSPIGLFLYLFEDSSNRIPFEKIKEKFFQPSKIEVPNMSITNSTIWVKIPIDNNTNQQKLILSVEHPIIDSINFYSESKILHEYGEYKSFCDRSYNSPNYLFEFNIEPFSKSVFYLKIRSGEQIVLPIYLDTQKNILERNNERNLLFGIYTGIMFIMFFYNLFLFFSIKDSNYIFYVLYVFFVWLTQATLKGYTFQYIWPNSTFLAIQSMYWVPSLVGIAAMLFIFRFLKLSFFKSWYTYLFFSILFLYLLSITFATIGAYNTSQKIIHICASIGSFMFFCFLFFRAIIRADREARFLFIGWSVFLGSVIIYILMSQGFFKYNLLTSHILEIGSAVEAAFLSFALADKINIYKKEKFLAVREKEKVLLSQKDTLREKVKEKTIQLEQANKELKRQALNAQIDPHFIFNSLNSIQNFILKNDKFQAQKYLSKFARLVRFQLNNSLKNYISVQEELMAITAYLDLEKIRFQDRFDYRLEIDQKINQEEKQIPTMVIIPFLENSVWHGFLPDESIKGLIIMKLKTIGHKLMCTIQDNGVGIQKSKSLKMNYKEKKNHHSVGIEITLERLILMHQEQKSVYEFEIHDISSEEKEQTGTIVKFSIPIKTI